MKNDFTFPAVPLYPSTASSDPLTHRYTALLHSGGLHSFTHKYVHFFILPNSQHCSAQAVPPLLTTSALEYSTELSKASLHYWTPRILNYTLKHSSKVLSFLRLYHQFLSAVQVFNYPSIISSHVLKTMSLHYSIHRNSAVIPNWHLFQII